MIGFAKPLSTLDYDYLDLQINADKKLPTPYECWLSVVAKTSDGSLPPLNVRFNGSGNYRFCISERLEWLKSKPTSSVEIRLSDPVWRISDISAAAINKREDSPLVSGVTLDSYGVVGWTPTTKIKADASVVPGARKLLVCVSNAHYRLMSSKLSIFQAPVRLDLPGESFIVEASAGNFSIPPSSMPDRRALYELRVGALDSAGRPLGYWSDPVSLRAVDAGVAPWRM